MRLIVILILATINFNSVSAQEIPSKDELVYHFGFVQDSLIVDDENIVYYSYKTTMKRVKI